MNRDRDFLLDIVETVDAIGRHRPDAESVFVDDEVPLRFATLNEQPPPCTVVSQSGGKPKAGGAAC